MGKKITQLATITEIADDDLLVGVDISDTSGSAEGTNKKFTKANLLSGLAPLNPQLTGWNPDTETWAYHSVDDPTGYIKIEDKDVSANYSVGWRIMFTNGGNVIKGIITAITFTDPDTIITFLHEIGPTDNQALYLLTNSAITENYFSPHKAPLGFPMSPVKWSQTKTHTMQNYSVTNPTSWQSMGTVISLTIPIGVWNVSYWALIYAEKASGNIEAYSTLSTTTSSETNTDFTCCSIGMTTLTGGWHTKSGVLSPSSKTTYYLIGKSSGTSIGILSNYGKCVIKATCAYL